MELEYILIVVFLLVFFQIIMKKEKNLKKFYLIPVIYITLLPILAMGSALIFKEVSSLFILGIYIIFYFYIEKFISQLLKKYRLEFYEYFKVLKSYLIFGQLGFGLFILLSTSDGISIMAKTVMIQFIYSFALFWLISLEYWLGFHTLNRIKKQLIFLICLVVLILGSLGFEGIVL